jgi:hypothetical protein
MAAEQTGATKRRAWHKLLIGIDAHGGEIVAFDLTDMDVDEAASRTDAGSDRSSTSLIHERWHLWQPRRV